MGFYLEALGKKNSSKLLLVEESSFSAIGLRSRFPAGWQLKVALFLGTSLKFFPHALPFPNRQQYLKFTSSFQCLIFSFLPFGKNYVLLNSMYDQVRHILIISPYEGQLTRNLNIIHKIPLPRNIITRLKPVVKDHGDILKFHKSHSDNKYVKIKGGCLYGEELSNKNHRKKHRQIL